MSRALTALAVAVIAFGLLNGTAAPSLAQVKGHARHAASHMHVHVHVSPNPTSNGKSTTVTATTSAGSLCTVSVVYPTGQRATSSALQVTTTADSSGRVSWNWTPQTKKTGTADATVSCIKGQDRASGQYHFKIT
ncbi:MAG TPA: hypothetical protein VFE42_25640 [Chloroflexota bacterium]|nr:hypothetical protein [Chloroflexota bacterium]